MIRVDKTHVEYKGTASMLLAEVTTLLRDLVHTEHILDEKDFDKMKEMAFKSEEDLKKEALKALTKDLDSFIEFLEKLANEADD